MCLKVVEQRLILLRSPRKSERGICESILIGLGFADACGVSHWSNAAEDKPHEKKASQTKFLPTHARRVHRTMTAENENHQQLTTHPGKNPGAGWNARTAGTPAHPTAPPAGSDAGTKVRNCSLVKSRAASTLKPPTLKRYFSSQALGESGDQALSGPGACGCGPSPRASKTNRVTGFAYHMILKRHWAPGVIRIGTPVSLCRRVCWRAPRTVTHSRLY